jgi:hypothetical protein
MVFESEDGRREPYRKFLTYFCGVELLYNLLYSRGEIESVSRKGFTDNPPLIEEGRGVPSAGPFSMESSRLPMKLGAMLKVEDKYTGS